MKHSFLLLGLLVACTRIPVPTLVEIPAGSFRMGSENPPMPEWDETPLQDVTLSAFRMSSTEITNAQYEAFDPSHKALRGYKGFSRADDEAVVMVSWMDATAYCEWLSQKTGRSFRLPTEAEWEYACRAGTTTDYNTGDTYPEAYWKVQENTRFKEPVSLQVAQFAPNAWGLYDMHGNVEEWCSSDYDYDSKVVRGGSHNTPVRFLRSANRSGSLPEDRSVLLGFRIVEAAPDKAVQREMAGGETRLPGVLSAFGTREKVTFAEPIPYVIAPEDGTPFYSHNHQPAVTWLPGGGLLAIWFSTDAEAGREMVVLQSVFDGEAWSPATLFCKVPDRNMTGSALLTLENGDLLHFQGVGDAGEWKDLALTIRRLKTHETLWGPLHYIEPEHDVRHQVIAGPIVTRDDRILLCCDAGPDGEAGTALHVSRDGGKTWEDTGSTIKGIHAGIVELKDGRLMAFGRGNAIDGKMPCSISADGGYTWSYSATEFPPIGSGQRLVLRRLLEGPLMLCSFGPNGLFVALSYDEGASWPVQKLLTDGKKRVLDGGAWTGKFTLDATHAEPKGYLACTQSPDGVIHLLSSRVHYRFTLAWLEGK